MKTNNKNQTLAFIVFAIVLLVADMSFAANGKESGSGGGTIKSGTSASNGDSTNEVNTRPVIDKMDQAIQAFDPNTLPTPKFKGPLTAENIQSATAAKTEQYSIFKLYSANAEETAKLNELLALHESGTLSADKQELVRTFLNSGLSQISSFTPTLILKSMSYTKPKAITNLTIMIKHATSQAIASAKDNQVGILEEKINADQFILKMLGHEKFEIWRELCK